MQYHNNIIEARWQNHAIEFKNINFTFFNVFVCYNTTNRFGIVQSNKFKLRIVSAQAL